MRIIPGDLVVKVGVKGRYPWHEWTDGQQREAERGVDYECSDITFGGNVRLYAKRNGLTVTTFRTAAGVAFQFNPPA